MARSLYPNNGMAHLPVLYDWGLQKQNKQTNKQMIIYLTSKCNYIVRKYWVKQIVSFQTFLLMIPIFKDKYPNYQAFQAMFLYKTLINSHISLILQI